MRSTATTMQSYTHGVDFSMMSDTSVLTGAVIGIATSTTVSGQWWRSGGGLITELEIL